MIDWAKYVDHVYVITCTKNKDKIPELYKELNRIDIDVYTDFVTVIQNINTPIYEVLKNNFVYHNPCMRDCKSLFISTIIHYYCMKNALENGYSKVLILEDDVRFLKDKEKIQYLLDNSIEVFNDTSRVILCCGSSISRGIFRNCDDYGKNYDIIYTRINHLRNFVRSSSCNIYNTVAMEYFCNFIESFRIEPSDAYEWIYDENVKIYVILKHLCLQQDWIKCAYNTCKDYNMLRPSNEELQEIRNSMPFGNSGEEIYQSIIQYL